MPAGLGSNIQHMGMHVVQVYMGIDRSGELTVWCVFRLERDQRLAAELIRCGEE
jgi:hypothetical protein